MRRVQTKSLSRVFGRQFALHRVSLEIDAGTVTGLVGENGAGKTTLLNILATLDSPSSGDVRFDKLSWSQFSRQARHHIGWVSHDSLLYGDLTGRENLEFFGEMYGLDDLEENVPVWLDRVGLEDVGNKRVNAYSRGMRQRLTLARALLHDPDLLLLDEPLTGLDQAGRENIAELFSRLGDAQKIIVIATHDLAALQGLATHLTVLRNGRVTYDAGVDTDADLVELYRANA